MSLLDPPPFSQRKRKRSATAIDNSSLSRLPSDSINPLSHGPGTIRQFSIAGLSETDANPSERVPDFPHRGLGRGGSGRNVEPDSDEGESEPEAKKAGQKAAGTDRGGPSEVLLQSVHQFLDQGEIRKAARAYGLLLQLRPQGRPIDVRHYHLWALGAEIIMREGEDAGPDTEAQGREEDQKLTPPRRWGRAQNMNKVKAYFETLIQQHPYDYKHPRVASALDFWIALLGTEIYNAHTEHVMALTRLGDDSHRWEEGEPSCGSLGSDGGSRGEESDRQDTRQSQKKDQIRLKALANMRDITRRMDGLMQDLPYSKNPHYLRLRAMAALYMADLVVPVGEASSVNPGEARRSRQMEQETAKAALKKIVEVGGELDAATLAVLDLDDDDDTDFSITLFSSLPIRSL